MNFSIPTKGKTIWDGLMAALGSVLAVCAFPSFILYCFISYNKGSYEPDGISLFFIFFIIVFLSVIFIRRWFRIAAFFASIQLIIIGFYSLKLDTSLTYIDETIKFNISQVLISVGIITGIIAICKK